MSQLQQSSFQSIKAQISWFQRNSPAGTRLWAVKPWCNAALQEVFTSALKTLFCSFPRNKKVLIDSTNYPIKAPRLMHRRGHPQTAALMDKLGRGWDSLQKKMILNQIWEFESRSVKPEPQLLGLRTEVLLNDDETCFFITSWTLWPSKMTWLQPVSNILAPPGLNTHTGSNAHFVSFGFPKGLNLVSISPFTQRHYVSTQGLSVTYTTHGVNAVFQLSVSVERMADWSAQQQPDYFTRTGLYSHYNQELMQRLGTMYVILL